MTESNIGTVTHYYNHLHVAGVTITDGELCKGDTIHVNGNNFPFRGTWTPNADGSVTQHFQQYNLANDTWAEVWPLT